MNEQRINEIKESLRQLVAMISQRGEPMSEEIKAMLVQAMEHSATRIQQLRQEGQQQQPPEQPPQAPQGPNTGAPSNSAQLLWILSGSQEDYFLEYLQTYPDASTQALLRNPAELERTIQFLHNMMPSGGQPPSEGGIPHADLNSSNIYGFQYDPTTKQLKVRFQGDGVYSYEGVPPQIFNMFARGAVPAKTQGQNQWGRWWRGKEPSLGASFFELIKKGGYPYTKVS